MSFSFGQSTSSGSSSLFGTASNETSKAPGGLFGSLSNAQPSGSMFGKLPPSNTAAPLGSTPSLSTPASTGIGSASIPSLFGSGANPPSTDSGLSREGGSLGRPAGLFSTPPKSNDTGKPAAGSTTHSLFGTTTTVAPATGLNSTTPAAPRPASLFGGTSTTPAGIPPVAKTGPSLFGKDQSSQTGASTETHTTAGSSTSSLFSSVQQSSQGSDSPVFGLKPSSGQTAASLFGINPKNTSKNPVGSVEVNSNTSAVNSQVQGSLFGPVTKITNTSSPGQVSSPAAKEQRSNTSFDFASLQKPASQLEKKPNLLSSAGTTTAPPASSLFGSQAPGILAEKQATPSQGLFSSPAAASTQSSAAQPTMATSASSTETATSSHQAAKGTPVVNNGPPAADSGTKPGGAAATGEPSKQSGSLLNSTAGPRPSLQSRLKNKSMDEIITRWASDLQKYQKEFQAQALTVASWDKILVTSSEQIQKLYGNTLEAERATAEVERQLTVVENDQSEIEYWLEHYEKQVDDLLSGHTSSAILGEGLQGPDAERERNFKLAERLSDRLTGMGKDLSSMVDEINEASKGLSNGLEDDDPLSQIVKVLNSHLSQLQAIDHSSSTLQKRISGAQASGRNVISHASLLDDRSADDFYKSYTGRR